MNITIQEGRPEEIEDLIAILQEVQSTMEHKEWFYLDPPEELRSFMERRLMKLWFAKDGDRIAAAFDILLPGMEPFNYGYDLGLDSEELMRVVNLDSAAVHPDYRGLKLQRKLIQHAEALFHGKGEWIFLCTIHPENRYSLQNALDLGYRIEKRLEKYGSIRYILRKDIS